MLILIIVYPTHVYFSLQSTSRSGVVMVATLEIVILNIHCCTHTGLHTSDKINCCGGLPLINPTVTSSGRPALRHVETTVSPFLQDIETKLASFPGSHKWAKKTQSLVNSVCSSSVLVLSPDVKIARICLTKSITLQCGLSADKQKLAVILV